MSYNFGSGFVFVEQLYDNLGNLIPVNQRTPLIVGTVQEANIDFSSDAKELFGSDSQFAKAVARGKMSISGKIKFGAITGDSIAALFFGNAMDNGKYGIFFDNVGTVIETSPIVIAPPYAGSFASAKAVFYKNSKSLKRVPSTPAVGQYSVDESTGTYTFATGEAGNVVYICYSYTAVSTLSRKTTIKAVAMGLTPSFRLDLYTRFDGKDTVLSFNKCISKKFSFNTKMDDFTLPEVDFNAVQDENGEVMEIGTDD